MRHNIVRQQRIRRSFTPARSVALVLGLIQVAGCTRPSPPAISALSPLPNGATAAPPRINGSVGSPNALPPAQFAYGRQDQPATQAQAAAAGAGDVSLDFADTDIREVTAQILGTILKVNYTI